MVPSSLLRTIVHCILDRQKGPVFPYYQCLVCLHYYVKVNKTLALMLLCYNWDWTEESMLTSHHTNLSFTLIQFFPTDGKLRWQKVQRWCFPSHMCSVSTSHTHILCLSTTCLHSTAHDCSLFFCNNVISLKQLSFWPLMEKPKTQAVLKWPQFEKWIWRRDYTLKFLLAKVPHLTPEGLSHFKLHVISHANVLYCVAKLVY